MNAEVHTITTAALSAALENLMTAEWKDSPLRKHLVKRRRAYGVSQRTICDVSGHNYKYVVDWDCGTMTPTPSQLEDYVNTIELLVAEGPNPRFGCTGRRAG